MHYEILDTLSGAFSGWHVLGDLLIDDAGNHYSIWEIRALRYIIGENVQLRRLLAVACPSAPREPQQLCLALPPMWKHQYEFLRRRKDRDAFSTVPTNR